MFDYNTLCKKYASLKGEKRQRVEKKLVDMAQKEEQDISDFLDHAYSWGIILERKEEK